MTSRSDDLQALMMSAHGFVFDKDGTLADLDARWVPFFRQGIDDLASRCDDLALVPALRTALGVDDTSLVPDGPAAVDTAARIVGRLVTILTERGHDPRHVEPLVAAAEAGEGFGPLRPVGDIVGSLQYLRAHGRLLGVATSDGRQNTHVELAALGVADLFSTIRCGDDDGATKPDPAVLLGIAAEWGIEASSLVFVGDSREDLETARGAGSSFIARCDPAGMPGWAQRADAVVASIDEMPAMME